MPIFIEKERTEIEGASSSHEVTLHASLVLGEASAPSVECWFPHLRSGNGFPRDLFFLKPEADDFFIGALEPSQRLCATN